MQRLMTKSAKMAPWKRFWKALLWLYSGWSKGYNLLELKTSARGMDSATWIT